MNQKGFSIVELMIAVLISSLLLLGVVQLFSSTSSADKTSSALARAQESGRLALEIIGGDARRAGYQGCSSAYNTTTVGSLTFPAAAIDTAGTSGTGVMFRYAASATSGTLFSTKKDCADNSLYLNEVAYTNCASGGTPRICMTVNSGTPDPILDNAAINSIQYGIVSGGTTTWKNGSAITSAELGKVRSIRVNLSVSDSRNEVQRTYSGTYELRNRL
ncbi:MULTISPECIES: PilW family protein [Pseudomonas]|uniref:PilW family protein n=1 Tax=Pseudomonas TaxID=286 RepID=UPI001BD0802B|nr:MULTISPECIES: prepilin-type N-terminal cleavage/methylation domain-containing protein [Pseudomonas]BBP81424.1 hypothetical protein PHLH8_10660 [Pseudomonas sp. Pc102]